MKGRKPKPLGLKIAEGRRVPKGAREPNIPAGIGAPPSHLDKDGREEWRRVSGLLDVAGLLKQTDRAALAGYCDAYSIWAKARRKIAREGVTAKGSTGNTVEHPCVKTVAKYLQLMLRYLTEFGLSPVSRARLAAGGAVGNVPSPAPAGSDIQQFIGLRLAQ